MDILVDQKTIPGEAGAVPYPPRAIAWFAVTALCLAQIASTIDRGMLALVIDPVRADLGISDVQIALLQGFAFSVFYVTVGLPLGVVADMVNRRRLLIGGIVVWSAATIGGGLSHGFGEMFVSRLFIGVGEAVLAPCAVTMITDLFPQAGRGRPMAVYVFGSMVAFGIGSLVAGTILQAAPKGAFAALPILAQLAPWRIAFVLIGASGFVIAALLFLIREPVRRGLRIGARGDLSLRSSLRYLATHRGIFLPLYGALAMFAMGGSAATSWGAVLLTRHYGLTVGAVGKGLGADQIAWAVLGALSASVIVDRVARAGGPAGKVRLAGILALVAVPAVLGGAAPNAATAMVVIAEITFASALYGTTMLSVIAEITPLRARGLCVALYAFVMTMIGFSLGPIAVAWLTQHVFHDPAAVGWSMAIVGTVSLALSALLAWLAANALESTDIAAALAPI